MFSFSWSFDIAPQNLVLKNKLLLFSLSAVTSAKGPETKNIGSLFRVESY